MKVSGILIRWCDSCEHYHSRLRHYCLQPKCPCPPVPKWRNGDGHE